MGMLVIHSLQYFLHRREHRRVDGGARQRNLHGNETKAQPSGRLRQVAQTVQRPMAFETLIT